MNDEMVKKTKELSRKLHDVIYEFVEENLGKGALDSNYNSTIILNTAISMQLEKIFCSSLQMLYKDQQNPKDKQARSEILDEFISIVVDPLREKSDLFLYQALLSICNGEM